MSFAEGNEGSPAGIMRNAQVLPPFFWMNFQNEIKTRIAQMIE
jgi:hypothetical protein